MRASYPASREPRATQIARTIPDIQRSLRATRSDAACQPLCANARWRFRSLSATLPPDRGSDASHRREVRAEPARASIEAGPKPAELRTLPPLRKQEHPPPKIRGRRRDEAILACRLTNHARRTSQALARPHQPSDFSVFPAVGSMLRKHSLAAADLDSRLGNPVVIIAPASATTAAFAAGSSRRRCAARTGDHRGACGTACCRNGARPQIEGCWPGGRMRDRPDGKRSLATILKFGARTTQI